MNQLGGKNVPVVFISLLGLIFICGLCGALSLVNQNGTDTISENDVDNIQEVLEDNENEDEIVKEQVVEENANLTHATLLDTTYSNPELVIGKSYQMTIYLEQHPTIDNAEFMSQPDANSTETILITCNMTPNDIAMLDGESAQSRVYKPYDVDLTFIGYDRIIGLYYEANCALK